MGAAIIKLPGKKIASRKNTVNASTGSDHMNKKYEERLVRIDDSVSAEVFHSSNFFPEKNNRHFVIPIADKFEKASKGRLIILNKESTKISLML